MARTLAWIIVVFSWTTAALISEIARWLFQPPTGAWCGNVISDPLVFELNVLLPLAFVCAWAMIRRCIQSRNWPLLCSFSTLLLFLTVAALLLTYRTLVLHYGLPLGRIWWLPELMRRTLFGR